MMYKDPNQLSRADSLERYYLGEELEDEKKGGEKKEEPAGVCENKLVVKFKLPKSGGVGGETTSASSVKVEQQQQHYCYLCKRGFNSGKALGGHMSSAHVQAGRDYQSKRRLKRGSFDDEHEDGAGGVKRVCGICRKVFPTEKSLHGHMRFHPERSYRGMNPPRSSSPSSKLKKKKHKTRLHQSPNLEEKEVSKDSSSFPSSADGGSSSSSPSDHDNYHEEDKSLDDVQPAVGKIINALDPPAADASEIPKSGKRSSFSSSDADNQSSSVPPTADEELSDLVNSLVSLRNKAEIKVEICTFYSNPRPSDGDQIPPPPPPPRDLIKSMEVYERNPSKVNIPPTDSDESDNFKDVKISIVGDNERKLEESPQAQGKAPLIMEPNNTQNDSPPHSSEEDSETTTNPPELANQDQTYLERRNTGSRKGSRIQKKGKGKLLSGAEKEKKKYKCSSCNRVFATHQALGGHMSSHNKISSGSTRFTLQNNNNTASDNNRSCSPENQSISQSTDNSSPSHSHPCLICSKIFSSGQALGGHMRCHASQLESSSSPQENNSSCSRQQKVLHFDLNELPNDNNDDPMA